MREPGVEVRGGSAAIQAMSAVCLADVARLLVILRPNGVGTNAGFGGTACDANRDLASAESLVELDELIDRANRNATEDVLSLGSSAEEREYGLRMLVVSRCVERIGDHAVDIGEQVVYLVTGEFREFSDASHPG